MLGVEAKRPVIALDRANGRVVLLSKNFDDEVEMGSEAKLDVSGGKVYEEYELEI